MAAAANAWLAGGATAAAIWGGWNERPDRRSNRKHNEDACVGHRFWNTAVEVSAEIIKHRSCLKHVWGTQRIRRRAGGWRRQRILLRHWAEYHHHKLICAAARSGIQHIRRRFTLLLRRRRWRWTGSPSCRSQISRRWRDACCSAARDRYCSQHGRVCKEVANRRQSRIRRSGRPCVPQETKLQPFFQIV